MRISAVQHAFVSTSAAQQLSWSFRGSYLVPSASLVVRCAARGGAPTGALRRQNRPQRKPTSEAEDASVQAYLQNALSLDALSARSLSLRAQRPHLLQRSTCEGWVTYLTQLADGDATAALAVLQSSPSLLDYTFDQQRQADLDQLQQYMDAALGVTRPQLLAMVKHQPTVLHTPLCTASAAAEFLLTQPGADAATVHRMVTTHPQLLTASVSTMQVKLRCLTGQLGLSADAALGQLGNMLCPAVSTNLLSRSQWLLQQGFTPAQVIRLALRAPRLLSRSTDVLQRRLDFFTQACSIPAEGAQCMLAQQPALWSSDPFSHLNQLKLQYWQQQLGYSLGDLPLAPVMLMGSLIKVASRHSTLCHLLGVVLQPASLRTACIPVRGGTTPQHFGPRFFEVYVQQQHRSAGSSVQDVLQPLAARLSQPAHQVEWAAALLAHPPLQPEGTSIAQRCQLYAALDGIAERDWPLCAHGRKWSAAAADAKAADAAALAAKRAATTAQTRAATAAAAVPNANTSSVAVNSATDAVSACLPVNKRHGALGRWVAKRASIIPPVKTSE